MRVPCLGFAAFTFACLPLTGQDPACPQYPTAMRIESAEALILDRAYALHRSVGVRAAAIALPRANFIDQRLFAAMETANVAPAALTSDAEFLRRISLDLTGRIPSLAQAETFLNDSRPDKRSRLIESLLGSSAFVDELTHWLVDRFEVTSRVNFISPDSRNRYFTFLRNAVEADRGYDVIVRDLLTASGDTDIVPGLAFVGSRYVSEGPPQDTWDGLTDTATRLFLGFKTECVSCHNGRGYLDRINLYLSRKTRREFWQLSAFFSRLQTTVVIDDSGGFRPRLLIQDAASGRYTGAVDPSNPGARPAREGASETPIYWFSEETPVSGEWRKEFARMLTRDRQFARAAVNYLWARQFGSGIVDPADGWDLRRVDPSNPPPEGWPLQNAHPELLEELTDFFIRSNYNLKAVIRLISNSNVYQLSSRYPDGAWRAAFGRYFARYEARRLTAEQIYDSLITATGTEAPYEVYGIDRILTFSNQLPDAAEPYASYWELGNLLETLGRGDYRNRLRRSAPDLYGMLYLMNHWMIVPRTQGFPSIWTPVNRVQRLASNSDSDEDVIRKLFLATLTRYPSADELATVMARRKGPRWQWLEQLQWALLNKLDFLFSY